MAAASSGHSATAATATTTTATTAPAIHLARTAPGTHTLLPLEWVIEGIMRAGKGTGVAAIRTVRGIHPLFNRIGEQPT
ncbi:hypothetical protein GCM10009754_69550 [Amycolatopsis minnesotensis]|uniref:Uncharacterized protein n=1 Tax=Amycolatopsis minnesotensis TaxID=337894 RepID=A0ABN2S969_9PSEU